VGPSSDLTRRALQVLQNAALIVADDESSLQRLLAELDLHVSPVAEGVDLALEALKHEDVAFLSSGWILGLSEPGEQLVRAAIQREHPVTPIPGPVLPLSALVLSGFPAHSFVWLGEYSPQSVDQQSLLNSLAHDSATVIALVAASSLAEVSTELSSALGNRPLVVVTPSARGPDLFWRGKLDNLSASIAIDTTSDRCLLIIGGSGETAPRWDEDRLWARVRALRAGGQGAREISQQLAKESGWPRREIYRMVVSVGEPGARPREES
jgi:16S rRNA (cytidine1402-2'-O)-methyltransferase